MKKHIRLSASTTTLAVYSGGKSAQAEHYDAMAKNLLKLRMKHGGPRTPQTNPTPP